MTPPLRLIATGVGTDLPGLLGYTGTATTVGFYRGSASGHESLVHSHDGTAVSVAQTGELFQALCDHPAIAAETVEAGLGPEGWVVYDSAERALYWASSDEACDALELQAGPEVSLEDRRREPARPWNRAEALDRLTALLDESSRP